MENQFKLADKNINFIFIFAHLIENILNPYFHMGLRHAVKVKFY